MDKLVVRKSRFIRLFVCCCCFLLSLGNQFIVGSCHSLVPTENFRIPKMKLSSLKSCDNINKKEDGSYRSFGQSSLFSDPLNLAKQEKYCNFVNF